MSIIILIMESKQDTGQNSLRRRAVNRVNTLFHVLEVETNDKCVSSQKINDEPQCEVQDIDLEDLTEDEMDTVVEIPLSFPNVDKCEGAGCSTSVESGPFEQDKSSGSYCDDLRSSLKGWALKYGISLIALSALLAILKVHFPMLPKDGRSLLSTVTSFKPKLISEGTYHYFGILNSVVKGCEKIWAYVPNKHTFQLQLNIDGLPLFHSSPLQLWPILGCLQGLKERKPFVIALFCGKSKPKSLAEYLTDLVDELRHLASGFNVRGKQFFLQVGCIICDAPARAFIKAVKTHTGYSSCGKCTQTGIYLRNRMTFPECNAPPRTDLSFRQMQDEDHHTGKTPLTGISFDMVKDFPHDYMHLICLGITRKLLDLWFSSGPLRVRLSFHQCQTISDLLVGLKTFVPFDFARKPRSLIERMRWKATELRQFLLYTGPVVLCNVLASPVYSNFMLLSVATYILLSPEHCLLLNDFAHSCLLSFIDHFGKLYGPEFIGYNVHGLVHLAEDVKRHGNLDSFSAFPFESYLGQLKKLVRKPSEPLVQILRRLSEKDSTQPTPDICRNSVCKEHKAGPVPAEFGEAVTQFGVVYFGDTVLKLTDGDNCVRIGNKVAIVVNILLHCGRVHLVYRHYSKVESFFHYPLNSSELGIFVVSELSAELNTTVLGESIAKYVRLPFRGRFVVLPLLHTQARFENDD